MITARPRPVRQLQHERHQGGRHVHRRAAPGAQVALGLVGRQGPRLLRAARLRRALRAGRTCSQQLQVRRRAGDRRRGDRRRSSTGEVDSVYLVYNEFKSVMAQRVVVEQLLPIPRRDVRAPAPPTAGADRSTTSTSRRRRSSSTHLLPRYVEVQVFRALLESNAAFYAAQMTAMDAATRNSGEMIEQPDALHEQGPAGGDHARDHRGRLGRAGAVATASRQLERTSDRANMATATATERRQGRSGHRPGRRRRVRGRPPARDLQRGPHRVRRRAAARERSTSSPRSSSTSARTACARSR